MSYYRKTSNILAYMYPNQPNAYEVTGKKGVYYISKWNHADPQPTEEEINTTASSQAFLDWEAENGGDPVLTSRKIVREAIDTPTGKVLVAFIMELLDRNIIPGSPAQVKQALLDRIAAGEVD